MIVEIKRLLRLSEIAQSKVQLNWNGTKVTNPMQQAAANRLYSRAHNLMGGMSNEDFVRLHREVIEEMKTQLNQLTNNQIKTK